MASGRRLAVGIALACAVLVSGGANAKPKLTSANSVAFTYAASASDTFSGPGCGATDTVTHRLPGGASRIKVTEPRVGDRDDSGATRVTAVNVDGREVTISVVADGPAICESAQPAAWTADYRYRATYRRRVQALLRIYYESYLYGAKWKLRPKTVHDTRRGGPPGQRVTNIHWRRFGGKRAIGFGRLRLDYCRPSDNCPDQGKRVKLVATKPDFCADSGKVEYLALSGSYGGREQFAAKIDCTY